MFYLDNPRGKEGMKTLPHKATMGATAGGTLRLLEWSINSSFLDGHGIKENASFVSVQTVMEIGAHGVETVNLASRVVERPAVIFDFSSLLSQIPLTDTTKARNMAWPSKKHGLQKTALFND
jgi:hypothetical protein